MKKNICTRDVRARIRRVILSAEEPFCTTDLFDDLDSEGITDRDLILEVLDELYDRGLIEYRHQASIVNDPQWAFSVA